MDTIQVEQTTYANLTDAGHAMVEKRYVRKARPIVADDPVDAFAQRFGAELTKGFAKLDQAEHARATAAIGKGTGSGYILRASDGFRALCERSDTGTPAQWKPIASPTASHVRIELYPDRLADLTAALKRMKIVGTQVGVRRTVTVRMWTAEQRLILYARDVDGNEAAEWIPIASCAPIATAVQPAYLLSALGTTADRLYLPNARHAGEVAEQTIIVEHGTDRRYPSEHGRYRAIVMPVNLARHLHVPLAKGAY